MKKILVCCMSICVNILILTCTPLLYQNESLAEKHVKSEPVLSYEERLETELIFFGEVQDSQSAYVGSLHYEDEEYRYFYDEEKEVISGIQRTSLIERGEKIEKSELINIADELFYDIMGEKIYGDVRCVCHEFDGIEYPVEYIETRDGFETGTRALLLLGEDGTLYAASFVLGGQELFCPENMLSEEEAIKKAKDYLILLDCEETFLQCVSVELKAYNIGVWKVSLYDEQNSKEWYVCLDVYSGEIVSYGYSY